MRDETTSATPQNADTATSRYAEHRGYGRSVVSEIASRTAEREGAFFLKHLRPGMRVLDVGCGPGTITLGLARAVAPGEVVGIDIEPSQIDASRALAAEQEATNLRFELGKGEALAFPDGSFDAVFSHAVVEHAPEPLAILREMRRVVRLGGLAGVDAGDWGSRVTEPQDAVMEEAIAVWLRVWEHSGGHPYLGREVPRLMRTAGFGQLQTTTESFEFMSWGGKVLAELVSAPHFVERVTTLGWADEERIARWVSAAREWAENPDGVWASLKIRTVGWAE